MPKIDTLNPPPAVLAKISSVIVHVDEMLSSDGHHFDRIALQNLLNDPDVQEWLKGMGEMALIPVKRKE